MAERPAFFNDHGRVVGKSYSFEWFPGFAVSQKQKSADSLHDAIRRADPAARPLEISSKSRNPVGVKLSAFNLRLDGHTLENIFQSAKVFKHGGPYTDLLEVSPKQAKRDQRLQSSGALQAFRYQGEDFPLVPKSAFYDYLYIRAVKESLTAEEMKTVLQYDYFTDIEFNPARSINTQARTAALLKMMLEEYGEIPDFSRDEFIRYHEEHVYFE